MLPFAHTLLAVQVKALLELPLLPTVLHPKPTSASQAERVVHEQYTKQVSCAICHVTGSGKSRVKESLQGDIDSNNGRSNKATTTWSSWFVELVQWLV